MQNGGVTFTGELETKIIRQYPNEYKPATGPGPIPTLSKLHRLKLYAHSRFVQWQLDTGRIKRGRQE